MMALPWLIPIIVKQSYSIILFLAIAVLPDDLPFPDNPLNFINFTVQEVFDALTELNPHKASGIDNIPPIVLKCCAQALTVPMHQAALTVDQYLQNGKHTKLSQYLSQVTRLWLNPISLLCIILKIFERLIYNKVVSKIAPLISTFQFGFQSNTSSLQQLLIYSHQLITSKFRN